MANKILVSKSSNKAYFEDNVFSLNSGDYIIMTDGLDYDTLLNMIKQYLKSNTRCKTFVIEAARPGSNLYTEQGSLSTVIISKT